MTFGRIVFHVTILYTNKNLYSAKFIDKTRQEALGGQLGGKQVSFKFAAFKCTVIITGSNTRRKTVPNFWGCYRKCSRCNCSVSSRLILLHLSKRLKLKTVTWSASFKSYNLENWGDILTHDEKGVQGKKGENHCSK